MNSTADSDIGVDHVQLWNLATGKVVGTLTDPGSNNFFPPRIAFSPDGRTLAAVDDDGTSDIYLWNMVTRKISGTLVDPQGHGFQAVTFSPDGRTLAAASYYGGIIDLWNTATLKLTHTFIDMGAIPYDIEFNSGGTTLAATDGSNVSLLNTATGKANGTFDVTPTIDRGKSGTTWQVALSSGANMLAVTINVDGLIYLWNTATGKLVSTLTNPHDIDVAAASFDPSGETLAAAGVNGSIYLWDTVSGKLTATFSGSMRDVTTVIFSPDGKTLAIGADNRVYVWNISGIG